MKKILIILSILPIIVFAKLNIERIKNTLLNITGNKEISFYNANKKIPLSDTLNITTLDSADIVLFSSKKHKSKITIVNSYRELKRDKNSIGAIYLKKGRTQIIFIKERLDRNRLILNPKFNKYILSEWQLDPKSLIHNLR